MSDIDIQNWKQFIKNKYISEDSDRDDYGNYWDCSQFREDVNVWELLDDVSQLLKEKEDEQLKSALSKLPRKFWEDEDHAVGGYISKKDLYELLKKGTYEI